MDKKILIPIILVVLLLISLVVGATYAYFSVNIKNDSSKVNINVTTEEVGSVTLKDGKSLNLNLTADNMQRQSSDIIYYATESGTALKTETEIAIATATAEGTENMYCTYELTVSISGTNNLYNAFNNMTNKSEGQLILNVNGTDYDFNNITFPLTIKGTMVGLSENNPQSIMASFRVINKANVNQSSLAGTDLEISFEVETFDCDMGNPTSE